MQLLAAGDPHKVSIHGAGKHTLTDCTSRLIITGATYSQCKTVPHNQVDMGYQEGGSATSADRSSLATLANMLLLTL